MTDLPLLVAQANLKTTSKLLPATALESHVPLSLLALVSSFARYAWRRERPPWLGYTLEGRSAVRRRDRAYVGGVRRSSRKASRERYSTEMHTQASFTSLTPQMSSMSVNQMPSLGLASPFTPSDQNSIWGPPVGVPAERGKGLQNVSRQAHH